MLETLEATPAAEPQTARPIVIDLGKRKRKAIKKLKRGYGPLVDEILVALTEVQDNLGEQVAGNGILPIIILYQKKQRRGRGFGLLG